MGRKFGTPFFCLLSLNQWSPQGRKATMTASRPWQQWGLRQNPSPALSAAKYTVHKEACPFGGDGLLKYIEGSKISQCSFSRPVFGVFTPHLFQLPFPNPHASRLQEALRSGDLQAVRAASAGTERRPWRRWVAAAYYLNKDWKVGSHTCAPNWNRGFWPGPNQVKLPG